MASRRPSRDAALGVAAGGVLLGHWITYLVASPHPEARNLLLARTGHAYLGVADHLALAVTLAALAAVFLGRLTRNNDDPSGAGLVVRLASFQVGAFVAIEVVERVASGVPPWELLHGLLLPTGIAVQIALAGIAALAIRWLLRAAARTEALLGGVPALPRTARAALAGIRDLHPAPVAVEATGCRGPPIRR